MAGLYEINYNDLEFYELCDGGNYGCVYRALWKSKGQEVAVKKVLVLDKEAEILSRLSHRNVVCFYGAVIAEPNFCLVMEYAEDGSLYAFLGRHRSHMLAFEHILHWARQIALGMNYLHNEAPVKVIHRDLKSKNVVITKDHVCKICDFGASRFAGSTTKMSLVGTYAWMAPEVIQSLPVSDACDVWSFGVVLWELLTHEVPFKGIEGFQIAWMVVENGKRLAIPSSCPKAFQTLMERCWAANPKQRPSFHEILQLVERMQNDDELSSLTKSYLEDRNEWLKEIEASLEELKKLEQNLGLREEELHMREKQIRDREKNLEKQFQVVELESYDVNTWREVDVHDWVAYQLSDRQSKADLKQYADLFVQNNINGQRLLMLSRDDLRVMGVVSQGHVIQLHKEIQTLKFHNERLVHFPPLSTSPKRPSFINLHSSQEMRLMTSCILPQPVSSQEKRKWKMLLDFYGDCNGGEETCWIKHVIFASKSNPTQTFKVSKYPFYMDKWGYGVTTNMAIECTVTFEEHIKRPRIVKFDHVIDGSTNGLTEGSVILTIALEENTVRANQVRSHLAHSQSSPMLLKGAWGARNMPTTLPLVDVEPLQESVWSDIVANKIPGHFPAYRPQFDPIPQVTGRSTSSRSVSIASSSSSTELDGVRGFADQRHRVDSQTRHEGTLVGQSQRLNSSSAVTALHLNMPQVPVCTGNSQDMTPDSGFISSRQSSVVKFSIDKYDDDDDDNNDSQKTVVAFSPENSVKRHSLPLEKKSPLTIASIVDNFIGTDSRRSSISSLSDDRVEAYDATRKTRSGSLGISPAHNFSQALVNGNAGATSSDVGQILGPRRTATVVQPRNEEDAFQNKSRKKKGKRKSVARQTTMDSMTVHGGNSKWMWKS